MPRPLSADHPNLVQASERLRRVQFAWAAMFVAMGVMTLLAKPGAVPVHWFAGAVLLALEPQPALLGMTAIFWGVSLVGLVPDLNQLLAIDPLPLVLGTELIENVALAFVRVILMITAWNQLLFYRMLYGTAYTVGLEDLPEIPEVVPNHTERLDILGRIALAAAGLSLLTALVVSAGLALSFISAALGLATLAIGLGVGVAFSPTTRRVQALVTVAAASLIFIFTIQAARSILL